MALGETARREPFPATLALGVALVFAALLWLTAFHGGYGYFIDELYYIACARHLAFGYVDHPPLAPALLALSRTILGDGLPALRLLPALCGGATTWLTMRIAWRLGASPPYQALAALCVMRAVMFYGLFSIFTTNCFEILFWTCALGALVELSATRNQRVWWWVGLFVGLAVLSKHTSVLLAGAIGMATLVSPSRRDLLGRDPWIGVAILLLLVAPNLLWEQANDWISLEFYASGTREGNVPTARLEVLAEQIGTFNAAAFPVWVAGFYFLLRSERGRPYRLVGWTCALLFAALLAAGLSRPDRVMGIYPTLFAAGASQLEPLFARPALRWLRVTLPVLVVLMGAVTLPVVLPLLSPEAAARYTAALGEENEIQREVGSAKLLLPLAHRMGSRELVEMISRVVAELTPQERRSAVFLTEGYPSAGAIELFGGGQLPPVYSPHNNYYIWGRPPDGAEPVIAIGFEPEQLAPWFEDVVVVARNPCEFCMGWRQNMPIAIARRPRRSLREGWPELRRLGPTIRKHYLLEKEDAR